MKALSFAIHTLGCKVNTYESDAMAESLKKAGFVEHAFTEDADIYIINTCTVTNIADRKSRQMLRRARKLNPAALIVAAGCYVDDAIKNEKLDGLISDRVIDLAVPNKDKGSALELIKERLADIYGAEASAIKPAADICDSTEPEKASDYDASGAEKSDNTKVDGRMFLTQLDGHTRAFVKVQDGCNMFCSYCIIPYVRGKLNSRPNDDSLSEIRALAENGVSEVVITGIHLTSMGEQLLELIESIQEIDGIKRIRLGSLEPTLITRETAERFNGCNKLCPHFHLSLQSGSNEILKRMNRHYTTERYAESCDILRSVYEHPAITTDIIVGFPGETEKNFIETCDFAERIGFYEAHVFKYSRRRGTPADRMEDQITEAVKAERSERLIAVANRLSHRFREYYIGRKCSFLSEELIILNGESYETGYNTEYVRCIKKSDTLHANEIVSGTGLQIIQEMGVDESLILM